MTGFNVKKVWNHLGTGYWYFLYIVRSEMLLSFLLPIIRQLIYKDGISKAAPSSKAVGNENVVKGPRQRDSFASPPTAHGMHNSGPEEAVTGNLQPQGDYEWGELLVLNYDWPGASSWSRRRFYAASSNHE